MSDLKKPKKITKQVRVEDAWHRELKVYAAKNGMTVTQLISRVCKEYFNGPATV